MKTLLLLVIISTLPVRGSDSLISWQWSRDFRHAVDKDDTITASALIADMYAFNGGLSTEKRTEFLDSLAIQNKIDFNPGHFPYSTAMLNIMTQFCLKQSDPSHAYTICINRFKAEYKSLPSSNEPEQKWLQVKSVLDAIQKLIDNPTMKGRGSLARDKIKLHTKIKIRILAAKESLLLMQAHQQDTTLVKNRIDFLTKIKHKLKKVFKDI